MTTEITRGEFSQLEARVAVVEREIDGEKMVTRHVLEQSRRNSDDLAAIKTRLGRVEARLDSVEQKLDGLDSKVDGLDSRFNAFVRDFPGTVAEIMRDVLRERNERRG